MQTLALYSFVTAAVHYFLGYALLTDSIRARLPEGVLAWLYCPFCSGFWYGALLAVTVGRHQDLALLGLPGRLWYTPIVAGLITMITTPVVRGVAFTQLVASQGAIAPQPAEPVPPPGADEKPPIRRV